MNKPKPKVRGGGPDDPSLHELVEERDQEVAGWRRLGYVGATVVVLLVVIGLGAGVRHSLEGQIREVERKEDPCSASLRGKTCRARTCIRLHDVGYQITPYCMELLAEIGDHRLDPGPGEAPLRAKK